MRQLDGVIRRSAFEDAAEQSGSSLRIERLSRDFGAHRAVSAVSFAVPAGQFVSVIGRSGAGKSTLLRLINRLIDPTEGRIVADAVDVARLRGRALREWRAACAMIFQQFNLAPRLDVLTNVLMGRLTRVPSWRTLSGSFTRAERLAAMVVLDEFGLADKAFQRAERLSGGQQQRVAIARALMQEPRYILADEPTASLDPANAAMVMDTLKRINRERGITVICNLHNVALARAYSDRVIALKAGQTVFDADCGTLTDEMIASVYGASAADDTDTEGDRKVRRVA